eukprot:3441422-Pyramimonas_sp.AAC.1
MGARQWWRATCPAAWVLGSAPPGSPQGLAAAAEGREQAVGLRPTVAAARTSRRGGGGSGVAG